MPQITINLPQPAVPRLRAALRSKFPQGLDPETGQPYADATDAEYVAVLKTMIAEFIRREVKDFESRKAEEQARASITDIDIS